VVSSCSAFRPKPEHWFGGDRDLLNNNNFVGPLNQFQYATGDERQARRPLGKVFDPLLLDNLTRDIQEGIIGAAGFRAEYALIVTWERMGYGGSPKVTNLGQYRQAKKWVGNAFRFVATTCFPLYCKISSSTHIKWRL